MKSLKWLMLRKTVVLLGLALLLAPSVNAGQILDPADIHVSGSGAFAQSSGGTDWVTLPNFNGTFTVEDISNKTLTIQPWHLVIATPNEAALTETISKIDGSSVSISAAPMVALTSGSAYDALGLAAFNMPASVSFTNFQLADQAVIGSTPTSYGLYDYTISSPNPALTDKTIRTITMSGFTPAGAIIFAYGAGDDGKEYSTAFTNAGVVSPVPEPSTLVSAALGLAGVVGVVGRRALKKSKPAV
jgi:hypothetical protein